MPGQRNREVSGISSKSTLIMSQNLSLTFSACAHSTLQQTHQLFDAMTFTATAAKSSAEVAWSGASLTPQGQGSAQQKIPPLAADADNDDDDLRLNAAVLDQHPSERLRAQTSAVDAKVHVPALFLTPKSPSSSSSAAFFRRIKTGPVSAADTALIDNHQHFSRSLLHNVPADAKDEESRVADNDALAGMMRPPTTPFAEKFVRREARRDKNITCHPAVGSQSNFMRRVSYDSPMIAPLLEPASLASSPKVRRQHRN
jgi:hypothetical protein